MNEMLTYIFGNLEANNRILKRQVRVNRYLGVGLILAGAVLYIHDRACAENKRRIDYLEMQIEELHRKEE